MILAAGTTDISPVFAFLTLVTAAVIIVSLLLSKYKQSLIPGYFLCGAILTNSGLPWLLGIDTPETLVQQLSEVGIILLMFTLGIEFSIGELKHLARVVTRGGFPQVFCTLLIVFAIALFGFSLPWVIAVVIGVSVALSSTAVSMKAYSDMEITSCPSARFALGVALFQDIFVIAFMALLPALATRGEGGSAFIIVFLQAVGFLALIFVLDKYLIPQLLKRVARTRSRELFTLTVIGLCAGVAFLAHAMNLSLALGAFVAGLVVSESIYSHRVLSDILPFKDVFLTIFFLSVGMLLKMEALIEHWAVIIICVFCLLSIKGFIVWWRANALGLGPKHSLIAAASLASSGEFSLVLLADAQKRFSLEENFIQIFIAVTALTMSVTPALMKLVTHISDKKGWSHLVPKAAQSGNWAASAKMITQLEDHAVICGYGPVGRSVKKALDSSNIPTLIVDLNSETIANLRKEGQLALFADATHHEAQELMSLSKARVLALSFPDEDAASKTIQEIRSKYPELIIIARTKFISHAEALEKAGANIVLKDEEEVGHAIVEQALNCYNT